MRIETVSGLRGELVAYQKAPGAETSDTYGWAIVKRDGTPRVDRPYSVHLLTSVKGLDGAEVIFAQSGDYDLTGDEALARFRIKVAEHGSVVAGEVF